MVEGASCEPSLTVATRYMTRHATPRYQWNTEFRVEYSTWGRPMFTESSAVERCCDGVLLRQKTIACPTPNATHVPQS